MPLALPHRERDGDQPARDIADFLRITHAVGKDTYRSSLAHFVFETSVDLWANVAREGPIVTKISACLC